MEGGLETCCSITIGTGTLQNNVGSCLGFYSLGFRGLGFREYVKEYCRVLQGSL